MLFKYIGFISAFSVCVINIYTGCILRPTIKMCTKSVLKCDKLLFSIIKKVNGNTNNGILYCTRSLTTNSKITKVSSAKLSTKQDVETYLKEYKDGQFDKIPDPGKLEHFKVAKDAVKQTETTTKDLAITQRHVKPPPGTYTLPHPVWTPEQLTNVKITIKEPETKVDKMAYYSVQIMRKGFDLFSGFVFGQRNERKWLNRIIFLETVAGVPGMVAAMARHMKSLRRLQRDYGWIHTLLEEAENERMHLLTALELKKPSLFFKMSVIGSQGVFVTVFTGAYIVSPKFCHRFVGYLEEEAVKTYTKCLEDIENGPMQHWKKLPATDLSIRYWKLPENATMKDTILAIRADEAHHRVVNHTLASMKEDDFNPYKPGQ